MDDPLKEIKTILRSVLVSNQEALRNGCTAYTLMRDYKEIAYEPIPFRKYGCSNMQELAAKMPDVIQMIRSPTEVLYRPVSSEDTKRIESLVFRQRSNKKKKSLSKGRRPVAKSSTWQRPNVRAPWKTPVRPSQQPNTINRQPNFFRPPSRTQQQFVPRPSKPVAMVPPSFPTRTVSFSRAMTDISPPARTARSLEQQLTQILNKIEDRENAEEEACTSCSQSSTCCCLNGKFQAASDNALHRHNVKRGLLPKLAIKIMERWYQQNIKHPYPSQETAESLALSGEIAPEQQAVDRNYGNHPNFEVPPRFKNRIGQFSTSQNSQTDARWDFDNSSPSSSWESSTARQVAVNVSRQQPVPSLRSKVVVPPKPQKSPTAAGDSVRTDYKSAINLYVQYHQFQKPIYDTMSVQRGGMVQYLSTVIINNVPYGSMEACVSKKEAEQSAARKACFTLHINVDKLNVSKPTKTAQIDDRTLKERIVSILRVKPNGLFSTRLPILYKEAYNCEPPDQPYLEKKVVEWKDAIKVEDITATKTRILYPVLQSSIKLTQSSNAKSDIVPDAISPHTGSLIKGYVSYVLDMNHFYVQRSEDINQIEILQKEINETYESRGSPKQLINAEPGRYCVAKFESAWYRAKILSVMKDEQSEIYKLFYIDYGNNEKVPSFCARRILESYCRVPGKALQCSLASVYPKGDNWDKEVLQTFVNNYDFSEELLIEVVSADSSCCSVKMYTKDRRVCINEDVVSRGLAYNSPLPPEPASIEFPAGKEWDVYISCIKSTVAVVIRIVGQNYSEQLEVLEEKELPKLESSSFSEGQIKADTLCSVKIRDGLDVNWYRVRVVKILGTRADVYFLDHGDSEVVTIGDLRPLPPNFNQLPYQAISCKLTGLESFENDARVLKALYESVLGETCVADVDDKCDKLSLTLWDTSSDVDININEKVSTVLTIEDLKPKLPPDGETVECYISHVSEDGKVYINIQGPGLSELNNMSEELNQIYSKTDVKLFLPNPAIGRACVAKFVEGDYEGWYRALIKDVYPKQRKVLAFYVDYGNTQLLPFSSLRQLSPQSKYLKPLPMQALPCQLYELPPKGCTFTEEVIARIVELCPLDELRVVEVVKRPADGLPQVELYCVDAGDVMQGISEILVQEGVFSSGSATSAEVEEETANLQQLHLDVDAANTYQRHRLISEEEVKSLSSTPTKPVNSPQDRPPSATPKSPAESLSSLPPASPDSLSHSPTSSDRDIIEYRDMMAGYDTSLQEDEGLAPRTPTSPLSPFSQASPNSSRHLPSPQLNEQTSQPLSPTRSTQPVTLSVSPSRATQPLPTATTPEAQAADTRFIESNHSMGSSLLESSADVTPESGFSNHSETVEFLQNASTFDDQSVLNCSPEPTVPGVFTDADLENLDAPPAMSLPTSGDKVYITWVADPGNFRCIAAEAISLLSDLMEQMLIYYSRQKNMLGLQLLPEQCAEGDIAAGFYDGFWYRVCLKKTLTSQVAVHFVDYGDYTIIPLSDVRVLTAPFRRLPFQAHKAKLAGVFPCGIEYDGREWSPAVQSRFKELVMEKTFTAWIHGQEGEFLSTTLLDEEAQQSENSMIHNILLREGLVTKDPQASSAH